MSAGAKLVDFGGWEMPLHYGSQIDEHHQVRRDAGMFDVSHMLAIDVQGSAAHDYLRRLLANDVARLSTPGMALYSCMLAADGGVLDDLIVYLLAPGRYRTVVNAATAAKDLAWMHIQSEPFAAELTLLPRHDLAMLALQGPNARERLWSVRPALRAVGEALMPFRCAEQEGVFIARTGYTGEDGFELLVPNAVAAALWDALLVAGEPLGLVPAGLAARDTLRLEAGFPLFGHELDGSSNPLCTPFAWVVKDKPAFGLDRLRAASCDRRLVGLV
ncbi:MAG: glycine cleavage system aminomethyltransferase GcvT, partial [Burkholderiales bacterium]|nr:glycine cleavage system aminomethyltransferase GcvT [Burkholderiales bacterium]